MNMTDLLEKVVASQNYVHLYCISQHSYMDKLRHRRLDVFTAKCHNRVWDFRGPHVEK